MIFEELGGEIVVQGTQTNAVPGIPLTVGLAGGGYVVIWQTIDAAPPGDVYARIYDAAGSPQGAAFMIFNDFVNFGLPRNVDAIALPNGGFAISSVHVTALDALYQPAASNIALQFFSATGTATTGVVTTAPNNGYPATEPTLAIVGDQLLVAWLSRYYAFGEKFDFAGHPTYAGLFPEFLISYGGTNPEVPVPIRTDLRSPAATGLADDQFLVAFRAAVAGDAGNIRYQVYNAAGGYEGFDLSRPGVQAVPHVATLANGNVILTWADYNPNYDNFNNVIIRGQILAPDGTPIGSELVLAMTDVPVVDRSGKIDGTTLNDYGLTALAGGGFAVSWGESPFASGIFVREFNSSGVALRDPTLVGSGAADLPHIAALAGGGYEVVWSSSQTQSVFAQTIQDLRTIFTTAQGPVIVNFNAANGWTTQDGTPRHAADINGDGYADLVGFGSAGVYVSYGSGSGSFTNPLLLLNNFGQSAGWTSDDRYHRTLADVNGDGRADVIGFGQAGTLVALAAADGSLGTVNSGIRDFGTAQGWTSQTGFARLVGDVNGDGKADIVGFGFAGTLVALGNGDGTFANAKLVLANFGIDQGWSSDNRYHRELADVNGDGKLDIVGFGAAGTYVALATGDGTFGGAKLTFADFGTSQGWINNDSFSRLAADVNGDGKADLIGFTNDGVLVAFGNGDGTFQPVRDDAADFGRAQAYTSDNFAHRELADVDHDGQLDIVGFGIAGVFVGFNQAHTIF